MWYSSSSYQSSSIQRNDDGSGSGWIQRENSEFVEFVDEIMSEYQPALTDDDEDEDCEFED